MMQCDMRKPVFKNHALNRVKQWANFTHVYTLKLLSLFNPDLVTRWNGTDCRNDTTVMKLYDTKTSDVLIWFP